MQEYEKNRTLLCCRKMADTTSLPTCTKEGPFLLKQSLLNRIYFSIFDRSLGFGRQTVKSPEEHVRIRNTGGLLPIKLPDPRAGAVFSAFAVPQELIQENLAAFSRIFMKIGSHLSLIHI